jgi:uncharacterized LabA/DUF88 family protein
MASHGPKVTVYVDGFNLYHGSVRNTPFKWLDIQKLCRFMLPEYNVSRIRYFTAIVSSRPGNPGQTTRQLAYLRALKTIPCLTVHEGFFLTSTVRARLTSPIPCSAVSACLPSLSTVEVHKTEEKGSDVNIATHLLVDAFNSDYEAAVIVSNDSDLAYPIEVVRTKFRKDVGILNPRKNLARGLKVDFHRPISVAALRSCQFPISIPDTHGTVTKPTSW